MTEQSEQRAFNKTVMFVLLLLLVLYIAGMGAQLWNTFVVAPENRAFLHEKLEIICEIHTGKSCLK